MSNWWAIDGKLLLDEENVVWAYDGILFSLEKVGNPVICNNIGNLESHLLSEISQTQKDKYCRIPLL
jgi:hypothetical protein